VTDAVRNELMKGSDASMIKKVAMSQGMKTLRDDAAAKVIAGMTTIAEVLRVTQEESA
jgi:general secretion pathway protein E